MLSKKEIADTRKAVREADVTIIPHHVLAVLDSHEELREALAGLKCQRPIGPCGPTFTEFRPCGECPPCQARK